MANNIQHDWLFCKKKDENNQKNIQNHLQFRLRSDTLLGAKFITPEQELPFFCSNES